MMCFPKVYLIIWRRFKTVESEGKGGDEGWLYTILHFTNYSTRKVKMKAVFADKPLSFLHTIFGIKLNSNPTPKNSF